MRCDSRLLPEALLALVSQGEERMVSLQLNCDIVPLMVTAHDGNLTRFLGLPFHVEKDFESAAFHDNLNFEDWLNVKSSYLLRRNSMQEAENKRLNANQSISGR